MGKCVRISDLRPGGQIFYFIIQKYQRCQSFTKRISILFININLINLGRFIPLLKLSFLMISISLRITAFNAFDQHEFKQRQKPRPKFSTKNMIFQKNRYVMNIKATKMMPN